MSEALAAKLEPKIIEACAQFIRSDPETLLGLASLWKGQAPKAEETQGAPTLGPGGPAQEAIPPVVQQDQPPSPVNGGGCWS